MDRALTGTDRRQGEVALLAALDLLVGRAVGPLATLRGPTALAYRHPGAFERVQSRLETAHAGAARLSPFAPSAIARAAYELAVHAGDATAAGTWRRRTGCVLEATVVGPLALASNRGAEPTHAPRAPGRAAVAGLSRGVPLRWPGGPDHGPRGRLLPRAPTTSSLEGLRALVVEVELARRQRLAFELETRSAATLVVGGQPVLVRPPALGGGDVRVRGLAEAGPGRVRIVARVGWKGEGSQEITLQVLGEDGAPVPTSAPRPGQAAPGTARSATMAPLLADGPHSEPERWLLAAAHLALGDTRTGEHLIEAGSNQPGKTVVAPQAPLPALLYARALPVAGDLPENRVTQRCRRPMQRRCGPGPGPGRRWPGKRSWPSGTTVRSRANIQARPRSPRARVFATRPCVVARPRPAGVAVEPGGPLGASRFWRPPPSPSWPAPSRARRCSPISTGSCRAGSAPNRKRSSAAPPRSPATAPIV